MEGDVKSKPEPTEETLARVVAAIEGMRATLKRFGRGSQPFAESVDAVLEVVARGRPETPQEHMRRVAKTIRAGLSNDSIGDRVVEMGRAAGLEDAANILDLYPAAK